MREIHSEISAEPNDNRTRVPDDNVDLEVPNIRGSRIGASSVPTSGGYERKRDYPVYDMSWQTDPACRGIDPTVFVPDSMERDGTIKAKENLAKTICKKCVIQEECLEFAISTDQKEGVWGGMNAAERRRLRR